MAQPVLAIAVRAEHGRRVVFGSLLLTPSRAGNEWREGGRGQQRRPPPRLARRRQHGRGRQHSLPVPLARRQRRRSSVRRYHHESCSPYSRRRHDPCPLLASWPTEAPTSRGSRRSPASIVRIATWWKKRRWSKLGRMFFGSLLEYASFRSVTFLLYMTQSRQWVWYLGPLCWR